MQTPFSTHWHILQGICTGSVAVCVSAAAIANAANTFFSADVKILFQFWRFFQWYSYLSLSLFPLRSLSISFSAIPTFARFRFSVWRHSFYHTLGQNNIKKVKTYIFFVFCYCAQGEWVGGGSGALGTWYLLPSTTVSPRWPLRNEQCPWWREG